MCARCPSRCSDADLEDGIIDVRKLAAHGRDEVLSGVWAACFLGGLRDLANFVLTERITNSLFATAGVLVGFLNLEVPLAILLEPFGWTVVSNDVKVVVSLVVVSIWRVDDGSIHHADGVTVFILREGPKVITKVLNDERTVFCRKLVGQLSYKAILDASAAPRFEFDRSVIAVPTRRGCSSIQCLASTL